MAAEEKKGLVFVVRRKRPHGQAVKTSPFHGGNTSSNLVGVIGNIVFGPLAQLVRATGS